MDRQSQLKGYIEQVSLKSDELRDRIDATKAQLVALELEYSIIVRQKDQLIGRLSECQETSNLVTIPSTAPVQPKTAKKSK